MKHPAARTYSRCKNCGGLWDGGSELLCSICHDGELGRDGRETDLGLVW